LEQHLPAIGAKRLVLTHMSDDVLSHLDDLEHLAAEDGMVLVF
jgi:phosphoribosyl 1,2-cyclic phosphodiesterase